MWASVVLTSPLLGYRPAFSLTIVIIVTYVINKPDNILQRHKNAFTISYNLHNTPQP